MKLPYSRKHKKHLQRFHPDHLAGVEDPKGHLLTKNQPSLNAWKSTVPSPELPGWRSAHCLAKQRLLPARGASGSPLTAPPSRHWKSLRTSSQLSTPSLRVDPRRARRRKQRQPRRQVRASMLGVRVAPFPLWFPLSRVPCAGGAEGRCVAEVGQGSISKRTAASPARAPLSPLKLRG